MADLVQCGWWSPCVAMPELVLPNVRARRRVVGTLRSSASTGQLRRQPLAVGGSAIASPQSSIDFRLLTEPSLENRELAWHVPGILYMNMFHVCQAANEGSASFASNACGSEEGLFVRCGQMEFGQHIWFEEPITWIIIWVGEIT